jgi:hypothetical protein
MNEMRVELILASRHVLHIRHMPVDEPPHLPDPRSDREMNWRRRCDNAHRHIRGLPWRIWLAQCPAGPTVFRASSRNPRPTHHPHGLVDGKKSPRASASETGDQDLLHMRAGGRRQSRLVGGSQTYIYGRSLTLLPPLGRRLGPLTGALHSRLSRLPPLRSHRLTVHRRRQPMGLPLSSSRPTRRRPAKASDRTESGR